MATESTSTIEPSGFFALRTALLPFDELIALSDGLAAPRAGPEGIEAALAADRATLRQRLRAIAARPDVRDALFVSSPDLETSLETWSAEPASERDGKAARALLKYVLRMAGRATPFGLCAGCSVGRVATRTRLTLGPAAESRRHTRLDMDYLCALTDALAADPAVRRRLRFRPNSSLYQDGGISLRPFQWLDSGGGAGFPWPGRQWLEVSAQARRRARAAAARRARRRGRGSRRRAGRG